MLLYHTGGVGVEEQYSTATYCHWWQVNIALGSIFHTPPSLQTRSKICIQRISQTEFAAAHCYPIFQLIRGQTSKDDITVYSTPKMFHLFYLIMDECCRSATLRRKCELRGNPTQGHLFMPQNTHRNHKVYSFNLKIITLQLLYN